MWWKLLLGLADKRISKNPWVIGGGGGGGGGSGGGGMEGNGILSGWLAVVIDWSEEMFNDQFRLIYSNEMMLLHNK